jgi:hypothetical protein
MGRNHRWLGEDVRLSVVHFHRDVQLDELKIRLQVNVLSTGLLGILLLPLLHSTARLPPPHPDVSQTPPHLTFTGSGGA